MKRLFYRKSGVTALWFMATAFFGALMALGAVLPKAWSFVAPPGAFWLVGATLACGAFGLLASGEYTRTRSTPEERYTEYVLEDTDRGMALRFTELDAELGREAFRKPWYPLWPGPDAKASSASIYPAELLDSGLWRTHYLAENFVYVDDVVGASENDSGLVLEVLRTWQRVRVPHRWPGSTRLREDLEAWNTSGQQPPFESFASDDDELTVVIDNQRFLPPAHKATFAVTAGSEAYGYAAMKATIVDRLSGFGVTVVDLREERLSVLGVVSALVVVASLVAFALSHDDLIRSWLVALYAIAAPIALTANHRILHWMKLRWELSLILLVPLVLLHLNQLL